MWLTTLRPSGQSTKVKEQVQSRRFCNISLQISKAPVLYCCCSSSPARGCERPRCIRSRRAYPELLETVALAHIVTGFLQRRPSLIQVAERLLACMPVRLLGPTLCTRPAHCDFQGRPAHLWGTNPAWPLQGSRQAQDEHAFVQPQAGCCQPSHQGARTRRAAEAWWSAWCARCSWAPPKRPAPCCWTQSAAARPGKHRNQWHHFASPSGPRSCDCGQARAQRSTLI